MTRRELFAAVAVAPFAAPLAAKALISAPKVSENMAAAMTKLVAADALPLLMANLVMGNLVHRDYEPTLAVAGDTINVPLPPMLTACSKHGHDYPRLGNAQFVLKHMEANFCVPNVARAIADPEYLKAYMTPAALALAESIEDSLLNAGSRCFRYVRWGYDPGYDHEGALNNAEGALFYGRVPENMSKYLVMSGPAYSVMRQLWRCSEYKTKSEDPRGALGRFQNFHVFRSQVATKTTPTLAFARDGLGLIMRKLPTPMRGTLAHPRGDLPIITEFAESGKSFVHGNFGMRVTMAYNPKSIAQHFSLEVLYGAGVLRDRFGVQIC